MGSIPLPLTTIIKLPMKSMNEQEIINDQRKWYLFFSVSERGLFDIEMELKQFDELFRSRFFDITDAMNDRLLQLSNSQ